jgi:hypothetical protein
MALAEALNCKIFAATEKARVLKTLQVNKFKWIQISLKSNTFRARLHLQNKPIFMNCPSTLKLFFKTEFQKDFSLQIKTFVSGSNHRKAFD